MNERMKPNRVKQLLEGRKPAVGSWLSLASPIAAEWMAHQGFDWLVVDMEHTPISIETVMQCFIAINTTDTVPMARVMDNDPVLIKQVLDTGAMGIVVPMVCSPHEAARSVQYAKYPPTGTRSVAGARCTIYGKDYHKRANDEVAVIVQIEHVDAVNAAREILAIEGVDAGFIGPNDLAWSMGVEPGSKEHEVAIQKVLAAGRHAETPVGIHTMSGADAKKRIEQGFQFVAVANDRTFMLNDSATQLGIARQAKS
ncbi:MAG: aldolase/citrate lyase family protein [Candidatus Poribacteria bacterium]|nr:aldolase/citrate lyase family protein [Candidatus Poribacteria bacterium]